MPRKPKYVFISSFGDAEALGLDTRGCLINVVIDLPKTRKTGKFHIVGFTSSELCYSAANEPYIEFDQQRKAYKVLFGHEEIKISATNIKVVHMILNEKIIEGTITEIYLIREPKFIQRYTV